MEYGFVWNVLENTEVLVFISGCFLMSISTTKKKEKRNKQTNKNLGNKIILNDVQ